MQYFGEYGHMVNQSIILQKAYVLYSVFLSRFGTDTHFYAFTGNCYAIFNHHFLSIKQFLFGKKSNISYSKNWCKRGLP